MVKKASTKGSSKAAPRLEVGQLDKKQTKLVTAKTRRGRRILERRAPKEVEDAKRALILYGNKVSQLLKSVLVDLHKLKRMEAVKYSRKNEDCRPFEVGGETRLEFYSQRSDCGLFALGSHTKKRPQNLVMGRFHDGRLYDALEMGVAAYTSIQDFGAAGTGSNLGSKPAILFVGDKFDSVPAMKQARSTLLDFFRGEQVSSVNLAGLDRVLVATAVDDTTLLLRQYVIKLKKSGTRKPRVDLVEMGPRLDLVVRRHRAPPPDLEKEAMRQPHIGKRKEKNVGSDLLDGKVGRIYMPKQTVDTMALAKPKGTKRERRHDAAERKAAAKKPKAPEAAAAGGDDE
uniref:Ribosome production factor 2 homolog n=1 Tax=Chlamydomonas leiostraca TaxID=1034604 RepID=A0A7S0R6A6_9CHLO|mmetsp:Transcript_14706/g.36647  ORF Transcript_14706/g.36647 Transcript_14706/m.36647 type:complete len:343 (+) Transcript_14706:103-1131(+)|eukprot:CAMPEP_0202861750 /NCGR_PEP_ID=MMETSP1391-20130828/3043_1 /ASSEMBLY_ACC=CAM_ASM_000867 /TAXON_ID=1034604 /ORGANISM="Chlamydomonas leiostraca, Strain SAG 11-49" /LENGTH=342 /DNA_ID=CAMNT_0049541183 /DNA_START=100 /DNA_END=1128 /DNA_ORIENTATION=-